MRKAIRLAFVVSLCATLAGPVARAAPSIPAPTGFAVTVRQTIAPGVDRFTLVRRTPAQVVNVVRFTPGAYTVKPLLAMNALGGRGVERTSTLCRRAACIAAINGDFFANRIPVGGIISNGEVIRTPTNEPQLTFDPNHRGAIGKLSVGGKIVAQTGVFADANGTEVGVPLGTLEIPIAGVNVGRPNGKAVLLTPRFGPRAQTSGDGAELVVRLAPRQAAWRAGGETLVTVVGLGTSRTTIPRDGAVVSGNGAAAAALRDLWDRIQTHTVSPNVKIAIAASPAALQSTGGYPVLLANGRAAALPQNSLTLGRQPRSMVGWTNGQIVLATFDGRQPGYSLGVTLPEATWFLSRIGVRSALNLDGGSSATFVVKGSVVNHPSDRYVLRNGRIVVEQYAMRPGDRFVQSIERSVPVVLAVVKR